MPEIILGKIKIFLDGRAVIFLDEDKPNSPITLSANAIEDLVEFLGSLKLETTEGRMAFRVTVPRLTDLTAKLSFNGKTWTVAPVDLSLMGILVEFGFNDVANIPIDAEVGLELRLDDKVAALKGIVRRRKDNQYGILIADSMKKGELDPPEPLTLIYKELERQWLRKRLK